MKEKLFEIDSAMNLIKEDIIRELYESVSKQNKGSCYQDALTKSRSYSEKGMD